MSGSWVAGWVTGDIVTAAEFKKGVGAVYNQVLGAAAASIDTGVTLPTTYAHMRVVLIGRGDTAASTVGANLRLDNDSAGNYYAQRIRGNAATAVGTELLAQTSFAAGFLPAATATAGFAGALTIDLPGYATATFSKPVLCKASCPTATTTGALFADETEGIWASTSAINRVTMLTSAGNFVAGTQMTVYVWGS